jgi:recombination protein RecT
MEEKQEKPMPKANSTILEVLKSEEFFKSLSDSAMVPDEVPRLIRSFFMEIQAKPALKDLPKEKILACLYAAAKAGVCLGPPSNEAYLFQRGGDISLYIGYKGLIKMAYQSKRVRSIKTDIIYEGDTYEMGSGDTPYVKHSPNLARSGTEKPLAYYAIAELSDGGRLLAYIPEGVMDLRHRKPALQKSKYGPWSTHDEEMCKKTVLKKLLAPLPVLKAFEDDTHGDVGDHV